MKTTLELPDDLVRAVKIRAAQDNRKLKDLVAELLRFGLESSDHPATEKPRRRVQFPLPHCSDPRAGEGMTSERVSEILLEQDEEHAIAAMRQ